MGALSHGLPTAGKVCCHQQMRGQACCSPRRTRGEKTLSELSWPCEHHTGVAHQMKQLLVQLSCIQHRVALLVLQAGTADLQAVRICIPDLASGGTSVLPAITVAHLQPTAASVLLPTPGPGETVPSLPAARPPTSSLSEPRTLRLGTWRGGRTPGRSWNASCTRRAMMPRQCSRHWSDWQSW